jgi:hypothetical protein
MPVFVEIQHIGSDPGQRAEIAAQVEHALADQPGDWKVSLIGSQESDAWEMKVFGPNGFERTYMLEGTEPGRRQSQESWRRWCRRSLANDETSRRPLPA